MSDSGIVCRPLTLKDAERCAQISAAISAHAGVEQRFQAKTITVKWQEPNFDLASSSIGIFNDSGLMLGYAVFVATSEIPVHPWVNWGVDPAYHCGDFSAQLLSWADEISRTVIPRCPPDTRISLWSELHKGYTAGENALIHAGYAPNREYYEMRIKMTERPVPPELPAGFVIRPYRHEQDLPAWLELVRDSFSDHYGHIEQPFEKDLETFRHWLNNDPYIDPDLVMLAADEATGELAGCVLPMTEDQRNPGVGYIDTVGVRRAFRRRGLTSAMLQRSFAEYWDRGFKTIGLDVDGESLTNAVALYERAGMHVHHSYVSYEKLLREGVELAKVAME